MKKTVITIGVLVIIKMMLAQGTLQIDPSFGNLNNGRTLLNQPSEFRGIAKQGSGFIVVGSVKYPAATFQKMLRVQSDGMIDDLNFFNGDLLEGMLFDVKVGTDSSIYVCGVKTDSGEENAYIGRFDKHGNKLHELWLPNNVFSFAYKMQLMGNGYLLVCGRALVNGKDKARMIKLFDNGTSFTFVNSFGTNGVAKIEDAIGGSFVPGNSSFYSLSVNNDGIIFAAGSHTDSLFTGNQAAPLVSCWNGGGTPKVIAGGYSISTAAAQEPFELYDILAVDSLLYCAGYRKLNTQTVGYGGVSAAKNPLVLTTGNISGQMALIRPTDENGNNLPFSSYSKIAKGKQGTYYVGHAGNNSLSTRVCIGRIDLNEEVDTAFNSPMSNYYLAFDSYENPTAEFAYDVAINTLGNKDVAYVLVGSETFSSDLEKHGMIVKLTPSTISNIIDTRLDSPLKIYPNPSRGMLNIEGDQINEIQISTLNGQIVYAKNDFKTNNTNIDLSALPQGLYFITVNEVYNKKFAIIK